MTIKVNGFETEAGCYVDGHWGQYCGVHLLDRALEFSDHDKEMDVFTSKLHEIQAAWPLNSDETQAGSYGADTDEHQGPWAALVTMGDCTGQTVMELSDEVLDLLNEHTTGGRWEWWEGECFLRETNEDGDVTCEYCHKVVPGDGYGGPEYDDIETCDC